MTDINVLLHDLRTYIDELSAKFVDRYIPADPTTPPAEYTLDVRAYFLLSHAAFEEFIEATVLAVADGCVDQWITGRKLTDVLLALLGWRGMTFEIDKDETKTEKSTFDYLRPLILETKRAFSNAVFENHGLSVPYLRNMMVPVALDINQDLNILNSLKKLTEGRGEYAHKSRVRNVIAPEDAKRYVKDVLDLCADVGSKALGRLN